MMKTEFSSPVWQKLLETERRKPYFAELESKLSEARRAGKIIYPAPEKVFAAFEKTPYEKVKVVIIGQDPYHQPGQACGLAFSVGETTRPPPSLKNIFKALGNDIEGFSIPESGVLDSWAEQGVLLLNTVLTVEHGAAHSHARWGWENFTSAVMHALGRHPEPLVFLLWGKHAQHKGKLIESTEHCILHSVHPSPLSAHRGFFDCAHFSQANRFLVSHGRSPIDWTTICRPQNEQRQQKLAL